MGNPIDRVRGKIVDVDPSGVLTIKCKYDNWHLLFKRDYSEAYVELIDSRPLSDKQRRMCFALIGAIAEWMGQGNSATKRDLTKEWLKLEFQVNEIETMSEKLFSLSDASMSLVAAFQRFLVRFCIENDVPLKRPLFEYVDDIGDYVYYCLIHKKCVICGKRADLHHFNGPVGMGRDRTTIIHEGMEGVEPVSGASHRDGNNRR
jgi:hypothetical protein